MRFLASPGATAPAFPAPARRWPSIARGAARLLLRPVVEPHQQRRIFVVGCPRSGTTVVQAALAARGNLLTLPETHFFRHLLGALEDWMTADFDRCHRRWSSRLLCARARMHRELNGALDGVLKDRPLSHHWSGRGYAAEFFRRLDEEAAARRHAGWLEKTPEHFAYIDMIGALCPDARFVHVMRAGEDVVASAIDAEMRYADRGAFGGGAAYWVRHWNRAMETHLRCAGRPAHHVVCHEDLVREPDAVLGRLLAFAGLDDEPRATRPGDIADVARHPWMRGALSGEVQVAERKFEALFGPTSRDWIRARLHDYGAMRAEIGERQRGAAH